MSDIPKQCRSEREQAYPYRYGYTGPKGMSAPMWMPARIVGFTDRKIKLRVLDGERGEFSVTTWPEFVALQGGE